MLSHEQGLLAALDQAWRGRGHCTPNPAVGAVAVKAGKIIASAFHDGAGTPHAEQHLLAGLPEGCEDVSIYVTLEPCNHWGKTPPCVDALIARRVKQVVYGYSDPNPVVSSKQSAAILRAHGIDVVYCPLPEIIEFYKSYHHWINTGRPWVTVKIAQTLNGKVGYPNERTMISNGYCFDFTHKNRLHTDVILTTANTVISDDPQFNVRLHERIIQKPVAVLDRLGKLTGNETLFKTAERVILYNNQQKPQSLEEIFFDLGYRGYHDVWVEAGPSLFYALHQQGLVHVTHIYVSADTLSEAALPLTMHADFFKAAVKKKWNVLDDNVILSIEWG